MSMIPGSQGAPNKVSLGSVLTVPRKGTPNYTLRLRISLRGALEILAAEQHQPVRRYITYVLEQHVKEKTRVTCHPDPSPLDRAVKRFMLAYMQPVIIAGLPARTHRDELEGLSWKSLEEAMAYAKTQSDPELRLLAMRVVTALMRVELAILDSQDKAAVDELFRQLEERHREYVAKAKARTG
jgi:hypothetical protein